MIISQGGVNMLWGFFIGFASCLMLIVCDHLFSSFRRERRARADFVASLSEAEQKQFCSIESMGDWQQARRMIEIERDQQTQEAACRARAEGEGEMKLMVRQPALLWQGCLAGSPSPQRPDCDRNRS